ncbi:MAG: hypothetical protein IKA61_05785 [Clostridia bacterium]|nr:hypothetical protein [Clostridia bacterium]
MLGTVFEWIGLFVGGLVLGLVIVLLIKIKSTKKIILKKINQKKKIAPRDRASIDAIIKRQRKIYKKKNRFHVFKTVIGLKPKSKGYFAMYGDIINGVAKLQNPDSQKPFLEFSISQAFDFIDCVTVDLEEILNALDMPVLKEIDLATMFGVVDITKRFSDIKLIKGAKRITKPIKPFIKLFKVLNPVKWVTGTVTAICTASLTRDLIFAAADIVAWEFAQFYAQCKNERYPLVA